MNILLDQVHLPKIKYVHQNAVFVLVQSILDRLKMGGYHLQKVPSNIVRESCRAMIGAARVFLNYLPHWRKTEDKSVKLGVFATAPGTNDQVRKPLQNLLSEMVGTFVLLFALLFIVGPNELAEGLSPIVVGLLIVA